jgi:peptidoglycan/LPS O-acetylase OafA/YrhL
MSKSGVLSKFTEGRDNNFNLIRIIAAFAVLVTHSFALSGYPEPLADTLGLTIGTVAVDVFFITSGFLVTASLLTRQSVIEFIWARCLRIFPALWVMLLLTVFVLGALQSSLPLESYFADPNTYNYFVKNSTLLTGIAFTLPGVFEGNTFNHGMNGSLWTMPYEVRMYLILAVAWVALRFAPAIKLRVIKLAIVTVTLVAGAVLIDRHFNNFIENPSVRFIFMFFTGSTFYILKARIAMTRNIFWLFVIALMFSVVNIQAFFIAYMFTIAYILMYLAYMPVGNIRKYNAIGDYSYGVYIYAFPVQQTVVALLHAGPVLKVILYSGVITLLLSILSWHLLESRALKLRGACVSRTQRMLSLNVTQP